MPVNRLKEFLDTNNITTRYKNQRALLKIIFRGIRYDGNTMPQL